MRKLHTTNEILDAIAAKNGGASDYRLGKLLNTSGPSVVNRWRRGAAFLSPEYAMRAAELLGWPHAYVLACVEAERSERTAAEARAAGRDPLEETTTMLRTWRAIAEHFRPAAASILLAALSLLFVCHSQRAEALTLATSGATHLTHLYLMRSTIQVDGGVRQVKHSHCAQRQADADGVRPGRACRRNILGRAGRASASGQPTGHRWIDGR